MSAPLGNRRSATVADGAETKHLGYRPEVDGLRAVAVLPVMLYHAGVSGFSGGFVGVDVFFVISGYLITAILLKDIRAGDFSLLKFYERRARRILPALFAVLIATFAMGIVFMIPSQLYDLSRATFATIFFVSNILFWRDTDYFAPAAEENPLLHMWSLSVEEQFYIIFPIFLLLVSRMKERLLLLSTIAVVIVSLLAAQVASATNPVANFFLLPTRAWELGIGALCALHLSERGVMSNNWLASLGLAGILAAVIFFDEATPFPSVYALLPVVGSALIILFSGSGTFTHKLLSLKPFVWVGLISYSAYLWHQPLLAFARIQDVTSSPPLSLMLGLLLLSLCLAYLSWRYVEQPFRSTKGVIKTRNKVFVLSGIGASAISGLAVIGLTTSGLNAFWMARNPGSAQTLRVIQDAEENMRLRAEKGQCAFSVDAFDPETQARLKDCVDAAGPAIVVLGDSHSIDLYNGVVRLDIFGESPVIGISDSTCRLTSADNECAGSLLAFLQDNPGSIEALLYIQAGFHLLETRGGTVGRQIITGVPMNTAINPDDYVILYGNIAAASDWLGRLARYTDVRWIGPKLEPQILRGVVLQNGCDARFTLRPGQRELYGRIDRAIALQSEGRNYDFRSQINEMPFDMTSDFIDCEQWLWRDGDHWSVSGSDRFVARLDSESFFDF